MIDINNSTLNETTLENIKNTIRNKPFEVFWAFTALTSKAYEKIYAEHRITLLLQCFEGYIYNKDSKYQLRSVTFKDRITEIIDILFEYEKKYNTDILKTLTLTEDNYINTLADTRHQFSHYINKKNSLEGSNEYIINFVLLHYIFRIYLLREINVIPKEKNIEEFLKSVYDWINSIKDNNFKDYKSVAYSMNLIFRHFN